MLSWLNISFIAPTLNVCIDVLLAAYRLKQTADGKRCEAESHQSVSDVRLFL